MKKHIGIITCLAIFLALQAPSEARPDKGPAGHGHNPKPQAHKQHMKKPPRHHNPHININYRYSSPCHAHHIYDCHNCYHRPPHRHHRGIFGSGIGFTIFL